MMMDLDESLRALYFAPTSMIVLDHNRNIKMINNSAETLLGVGGLSCSGQRLERYLAPASRSPYTLSLNEASENITKSITGMAAPSVTTRLSVVPFDGIKPPIWSDFSIAAWHPNDTIFRANEATKSPSSRRFSTELHGSPPEMEGYKSRPPLLQSYTSSLSSIGSPSSITTSSSITTARLPHEALFTITIWPCRDESPPSSSRVSRRISSSRRSIEEVLKDSIFQNLDVAVLALSKDGHHIIQNKACQERFPIFVAATSKLADFLESERGGRQAEEEDSIHLKMISETMNCYDETFTTSLTQQEWPFFKCASLGQTTEDRVIGIEAIATGERALLRVTGKPMRDNGGYGRHIGGIFTMQNVTAQRAKMQLEAESQSDQFFKQTCDALPQMVWIAGATGYVEWFSRAWFTYTGGNIHNSQGVGWTDFVKEEDGPEASRRWSHSLRTGTLYEVAYRLRNRDGIWRWFLGRALPMFNQDTGAVMKWLGTCTDIHDQVEALSASRRAQGQLESVINHAAITLWAVDREGRITIAEGPGIRQLKLIASERSSSGSERAPSSKIHKLIRSNQVQQPKRISPRRQHSSTTTQDASSASDSKSRTHSSKKSMVGKSIYDLWDRTDIEPAMTKALAGETVVEEMELDGRWFRTSYTPLRAETEKAFAMKGGVRDSTNGSIGGSAGGGSVGESFDETEASEGEIIGVVGASMDITDRKKAQEKMEESLLEKTRALAAEGAARDASRLKSEFLANMSHEIRTPIAGVIGLSELLLDEKGLNTKYRDYVETIQRSAEGLLTVINDVLDFSKVEIGKLEVEQAPFNLEVVLRDSMRMLSFATQKKGLEFRESVQLNYQNQIVGDVGRLRQVITNLLTNAIKFTSQGYISLEATELSEDESSVVVRIDVRDTGCGISPETLGKLFQPFSQADPSTARRFGGTGLGLSISKKLVELMDGEIGLESVEGQGSHAWFYIPFRKATMMEEDQVRSKLMEASLSQHTLPRGGFTALGGLPIVEKTALTRPRKDIWILIAEDNIVNAQIASKNIAKMGFSCRTAENGEIAVQELKRHRYDAVLMDCQMPQCDGYQATRLIRQSSNPDIRALPIIALTASAIKGDRERALDAGMVDYLAKPVKRAALETTLCKWLFDNDARQSLSAFFARGNSPSMNTNMDLSDDVTMGDASFATAISTQ